MLSPVLRLDELTRKDIQTYTEDQISRSEGSRGIRALYPSETAELVTEIISRAHDVFLWVTLVIRVLLKKLREGNDLAELQTTLRDFPDDFLEFYKDIWRRIEPKYRREASRFSQVREACKDCGMSLSVSSYTGL